MLQSTAFFSGKPRILAPLAGYSDLPFRLLCREQGADLTYSEMISCHGLSFGQKNTLSMLTTIAQERPVVFQLFGSDPEMMGRAAAILDQHPIDMIDINMGCPVRKVIKKGSGAALMKDFHLAGAIIRTVCNNTSLPVSVKFRSGWLDEEELAPQFGCMAQEAGASVVTVHGRSWAQGFGGRADWQVIARVKEAVDIPVIGNGDITNSEEAELMFAQTGCDGIMIGRGALGNPWIFGCSDRPQDLSGRLPVIQRYLELVDLYPDPIRLLFRIKNHTARFLSGLHSASAIRQEITACPTLSALRQLFDKMV
jgi:nifR3 family TIM-barrel protein